MRLALSLHPESVCPAVAGIAVEAAWAGRGVLALRYVVTGDVGALAVPAPATPGRADGLWKTTCFEAFVAMADGAGYVEFNLSPSGRWAAYRFDGHRAGMAAAPDVAPPRIETRATPERLALAARLALPSGVGRRIGLSAVIEATDGTKSYWALAHPPGRPDFHHRAGFAYDLPLEAP